jgi:hypothetical protein
MQVFKNQLQLVEYDILSGSFHRLVDPCNLKYMERCHSCDANSLFVTQDFTDFCETWNFIKYIYIHKILLLVNLSQLNLLHFLIPYLFCIKMEGYQLFKSIFKVFFTHIFHRSPAPNTNEFLALLCNMSLQFLPRFNELMVNSWWLFHFLTFSNNTNYEGYFAKCSASTAFLSKFHLISNTMI